LSSIEPVLEKAGYVEGYRCPSALCAPILRRAFARVLRYGAVWEAQRHVNAANVRLWRHVAEQISPAMVGVGSGRKQYTIQIGPYRARQECAEAHV